MTAFFDGHNDSLTREDHARFATGREGGHLDLPRMKEADMRGGIFAVFIRNPETADYQPAKSNRPGGATRAQCVWIGTSRKNRSEKVSTRSSIRKRRVRSR